jgi:HD-GYP domain-containing protein (c-di-GMP phosphodiesterase class II)
VDSLLLAVLSAADRRLGKSFTSLIDGLADTPLHDEERQFIQQALQDRHAASTAIGAVFHVRAFDIDLALFTRDAAALASADSVLLELFLNKVAQAIDNHQTFSEILRERDSLVRNSSEAEEHWGGHDDEELRSMQCLAREVAARLQQRLDFPGEIDDWFVFTIGTACAFHDLGVQTDTHRLLEQAGPLSDDERATMQQHTRNGVELLRKKMGNMQDSRLFAMSEQVILQHHERYDGSGYPAGLVGDAIALPAKIIGAVDCYVAMTSPRSYRPAHDLEAALQFITDGRGTQFDPRIVDALMDVIESRRGIEST